MEAPLYNQKGSKIGTITLPDGVFGLPWKSAVVQETVRLMRASRRKGTAHAKGRGEVRGGGKKPWRQKGTGRARHGSIRSPIWVGGGVTHGPTKDKVYARKINKNVKRRALFVLLSQKLKEGEVFFVDALSLGAPKTKEASALLRQFSEGVGVGAGKQGGRTLILLEKSFPETIRAFRNLPFVSIGEVRNLNVEEALAPKYLILTKDSITKIGVTDKK